MATTTDTPITTTITDQSNDKTTTLDATTYQLTIDQGTILSQNQPIKMVTENMNSKSIGIRADRHMKDVDWNLQKMLSRHNFVGAYEWNTGQAVGTELAVLVNPYELVTTAIGLAPFDTFTYARWKELIVYVQVQATRFQCGSLNAFFHPSCIQDSETDPLVLAQYTNRQNSVLLNHSIIEASQSDMVEFRIPFVWNKGWLDLQAQDTLGTFHLAVFNQLRAATGTSTAATVTVYMSLEGAEFRIPRPLATPVFKKKTPKMITGEKQSALLGTVNEVTKFLEPIASVVDLMGNLLLDKKQISAQYYPVTNKQMGYLTHQKNEEYVDRLTLNPNTMQMTDMEHYNSDVSVLKMDYFTKHKWNIIDTKEFSNVSTTGTILAAYDVGPMGFSLDPSTTKTLTTVDYLARRFQYWRGSFYMMLQFIVAPLHEGRIIICFRPAVDKTVVGSYAQSQTQYMASFQVKGGQNCFGVRIPYLSQTPYNIVYNGQTLTTQNYNDYFNGSIQIISATPLKVTDALPNSVDFNIYIAGGDDFELHTPTYNNSSIVTDFVDIADDFVIGEKQSTDTAMTMMPLTVNDLPSKMSLPTLCGDQSSKVSDPQTSHFGEHYTDMQQILKRYQPGNLIAFKLSELVTDGYLTPAQANDVINGAAPLVLPIGNTTYGYEPQSIFRQRSFLGDIVSCFRLQRAPVAFKFSLRTIGKSNVHGYITYFKQPPNRTYSNEYQELQRFFPNLTAPEPFVGGPIMPLTYVDENHTAEFYLPFIHHQATSLIYQPYDYQGVTPSINVENDFNRTEIIIAIYNVTSLDQVITIQNYFSLADESSFGLFQGLPAVSFQRKGIDEGPSLFPDHWF
jgi:hypothetical protein